MKIIIDYGDISTGKRAEDGRMEYELHYVALKPGLVVNVEGEPNRFICESSNSESKISIVREMGW